MVSQQQKATHDPSLCRAARRRSGLLCHSRQEPCQAWGDRPRTLLGVRHEALERGDPQQDARTSKVMGWSTF